MRTRTLAVAGLLLVSSGAIGFASIEAQSSDPPPIPQPNDTGPDTLVQSREAGQQARRDAIRARGAEARLVAMRPIVRAHFRAPQRNSVRITNSDRLNDQDAEEVALFLTMLGYDPSTLQGQSANARSLVESASAVLFGVSTIDHELRVSPVVIHGRLTGVANASIGDGYNSVATFEIVRSIKGDLPAGSTLQLKQRSGRNSSGEIVLVSGEFLADMTGEYLIFVSPEMYRFRANPRVTTPDPVYYASFLAPYRVQNGRGYPMGEGQQSSGFAVNSLP